MRDDVGGAVSFRIRDHTTKVLAFSGVSMQSWKACRHLMDTHDTSVYGITGVDVRYEK